MPRLAALAAALAGTASALKASVAPPLPGGAASFAQAASEAAMLREFHTQGQQMPMPVGEQFTCDVDSSGPICLAGQQRIFLPEAKPPGLVGYWSFDDAQPVDTSGSGNHGVTPVEPGPAMGGRGASAAFHRTYLTIPGGEQLTLQDFTYTFWLHLRADGGAVQESGLRYCPVVRKGLDNSYKQHYSAAPAVLFDRQTRRIRVELATTAEDGGQTAEALESNARLRPGSWFHIAVVRLDGQKRTRLYVNGLLDSSDGAPIAASDAQAPSKGYVQPNKEPLYVGGDPLMSQSCDVPMYVDELRVYSRPLEPDEIQAEAAPALSGVEPSFVRLACVSCPLETAMTNCPDGYHICNELELHMGGYQVARSLGWMTSGTHVWSHAAGDTSIAPVPEATALLAGGRQPTRPAASVVIYPPGMAPPPASPAPAQAVEAPAAEMTGLGLCCSD